ncbi:hypothetical protein ADK86_36685 [Streptomyces sp. NRRL F-5755]|uniref:DUF5709 domain-containing protein n=1 Tax=Streptomyces sp. NRRL F-5755 TaxID=1519475 RepID=UPI0006AF7DF0|nr:DUF5709 domain-containing protein [Streptomyces sp. NRRL F-5755]KOT87219.1 hypothetical protein ADK86_36685 [Streptomyces sp. NRRL F-5755]
MSDESMGDEVYQPTASDKQGTSDELDMEDALDEPDYDEMLDQGYSPPEKPLAVNQPGTTANEQRAGESLDERLAKEQPDVEAPDGDGIGDQPDAEGEPVDRQVGDERAGRMTGSDEGDALRLRDDEVGRDVGIDGGAASAEEAAVHIVDDPDLSR